LTQAHHLTEANQLAGLLVSIDAMSCQVEIADKIDAHGANYLLALKGKGSGYHLCNGATFFMGTSHLDLLCMPIARDSNLKPAKVPTRSRPLGGIPAG